MQLRSHKTEKSRVFPTPSVSRGVCVETAGVKLHGALDVPVAARGLVLFASSRKLGRLDPQQISLAQGLNRRGLGTLLFDLVEDTDGAKVRSKVDVLTERLLGATRWSAEQWGIQNLPIGYVGSGLDSAVAMLAAARLGHEIKAVASYQGRPDLALDDLREVCAPTLLVVDRDDPSRVLANEFAATQLRCPHRLRKVGSQEGWQGMSAATPAVYRWMEWHLGWPGVPYEPRLILSGT